MVLKDFIWQCCIAEDSVCMLFQVSLQMQGILWLFIYLFLSTFWSWIRLNAKLGIYRVFSHHPWKAAVTFPFSLIYEEETLVMMLYFLVANRSGDLLSAWDAVMCICSGYCLCGILVTLPQEDGVDLTYWSPGIAHRD